MGKSLSDHGPTEISASAGIPDYTRGDSSKQNRVFVFIRG